MTTIYGNIITPDRIISGGEIAFNDSGICYVGNRRNTASGNIIDCGDNFVSPGFVDIHIHGGGGFDFTDGTLDAFLGAARLHIAHGTTSLLPTTLSCSDEELFAFFDTFEKARGDKEIGAVFAGIHIEGPYVAMAQKGAQDERYIKIPKYEHYNKIIEKSKWIKRWTIAPELDGALELGKTLRDKGILPCIGHSDALYDQAIEAYENGYTLMTHFYSGMSSMVRKNGFRFPGLIESGYLIEGMDVEVIADGCHLPLVILNFVYKQKGADKVALVTDAMRAAGQTEGMSVLGSLDNGLPVIIEDGVAKLTDRTAFGGSIATMDRLVRTMISAGVPLVDAVKMATKTPARMVGLLNKGVLATGFDADILIFDKDINIKTCFIGGQAVK